jgi:hypothetical protein
MDYCDCKAGLRAATPETGAGTNRLLAAEFNPPWRGGG